ncbi:MAG: hypothetical protein BYD32DRAFT_420453 [Podila humilis]|nr:MAG: hypothetical protein BYD32DRAFT_420453 [Podila humilis]
MTLKSGVWLAALNKSAVSVSFFFFIASRCFSVTHSLILWHFISLLFFSSLLCAQLNVSFVFLEERVRDEGTGVSLCLCLCLCLLTPTSSSLLSIFCPCPG